VVVLRDCFFSSPLLAILSQPLFAGPVDVVVEKSDFTYSLPICLLSPGLHVPDFLVEISVDILSFRVFPPAPANLACRRGPMEEGRYPFSELARQVFHSLSIVFFFLIFPVCYVNVLVLSHDGLALRVFFCGASPLTQ